MAALCSAVLALSAGAEAVTRHETTTAAQVGGSPLLVSGIQPGTDQTYVLFIATRSNDDVTSVTGGGLGWTERKEQCAGRDQQGIRVWTATGSPGSAFTVTINWNDTGSHPIVAIVTRYSAVGSVQDPQGENTNGPNGACANGPDDGTALLTLTSGTDNSVHVVGVNSRNHPIIAYTGTYTQTGTDNSGDSGDLTTLYTFDRALATAGADPFSATIDNDTVDWCTAGVVLSPGGPPTVNYRSIGVATGALDSGSDATINATESTVTLGGSETFAANIGQGDKLTIAGGAGTVAFQQATNGSATDSFTMTMQLLGGSSQTYVMFVSVRSDVAVTNVTGGGMTWTPHDVHQCGDDSETSIWIFTAQGSPVGQFGPSIYVAVPARVAVAVQRYSGVGTIEDATGWNNNGENGSCTNATDTDTAEVTLTSTASNSVHVVGVAPRGESVNSYSAGYDLRNGTGIGGGPQTTAVRVYEKTFATPTTDQFTATLSGTTDWAAAGIVLNPSSGNETFHVLSRDSDTTVTVQETASSTLGNQAWSVERAYNHFWTWKGDRAGDLVNENRTEVGVCYNDGPFVPEAFAFPVNFWTSTTDANRYMKVTVAPGHRHDGTAGSGARVSGAVDDVFQIQDAYTVIEWLEIEGFSGAGVDAVSVDAGGTNALLQNLLIYDFTAASTGINVNETATVRNCILHDGASGVVVTGGSGNATVENTTIYNMTFDGVEVALGNKLTMRNCIAVGSFVDVDLAGTVEYFGYNMYDQWTGQDPTGFNGYLQSPPADLEDLFLSIASPENLHLEASGHTAGNAGIDLSSSFSNDIDDDTRTGTWDLGADEAIPGSASSRRVIHWRETNPYP